MQYRLGSIPFPSLALEIPPLVDVPIPARGPGGAARSREMQEAVARWVERLHGLRRGGASPGRERPDLLEALPGGSSDRAWVAQAAEALEARRRRSRHLALLRCEWERDGGPFVAISAHDPSLGGAVRLRDTVSAGFVAIRDGGGLRVLPRIYRKICANGAVVFLREGKEALATEGNVGAAIEACFGQRDFEEVVRTFRRAARTPLPDPAALLARARAASPPAEVLARFEREGDRTAWGLINAATAAAREEPDFRLRVERERDAERILRALGSRTAAGGGGAESAVSGRIARRGAPAGAGLS